MANDPKLVNRLAKSDRLVDFVVARGIVAEAVTYNDSERAEVAAQAGEKPPSDDTWLLVMYALAQIVKPTNADPFAGLTPERDL